MSVVTRHFWGWDAPVLDKAAAFLMTGLSAEKGAPDFADTLVIVPTAEAGRRLREALARSLESTGVLAPVVWTAEQALLPQAARAGCATPLQAQVAWQRALERTPPERLKALFPKPPEERGWVWQVEMARLLAELNALTGAGGLAPTEVAKHAGQDAARWQDLALLAEAQALVLQSLGLEDAQNAKRRVAAAPVLPDGVKRVVILAAPDLPPLFDRWAAACAEAGIRVVAAVHAPEAMAHTFDPLGRPDPASWGEDAEVALPFGNEALHLCHDATAQAERVIAALRESVPAGRVALGVADAEVGAILVEKLALEEVAVFEPGGMDPRQTGLWHLLSELRALLGSGSWRSFARLLRVPEMRAALAERRDKGCALLEAADDFAAAHLPVTLRHARELLKPGAGENEAMALLSTALHNAGALLDKMSKEPLPEAARHLLMRLYGERLFRPDAPEDHRITEAGDAWLTCCEEIQAELDRFKLKLTPEEKLALSLDTLGRAALSETRGDVDLVLQGWLELLWESAPQLIVAGMNEEHVPGILLAHPFLPDGLRQKLGLPCQATRFARDAYLLRALAEPRVRHGSLRLFCGQWSERGDALRPSRLLFLCPDTELPQRVEHLFPKHEEKGAAAEPPRTLAWKLRPRLTPPKVETISPSRLSSYLDCPFRHYLSCIVGMESVNPEQREMNVMDFGNLAHHALQQLALDPAMRACTDVETLADFLVEAALHKAAWIYGRRPAPLVALQLEGLKQRLRHAAEAEAAERAAGWRILRAEWSPEQPVLIEGAELRLKIDRVDRHEGSGRIRVLDYKTSDKARDPREAHAAKTRRVTEGDEWKTFAAPDGVMRQWNDLQLPLYAATLRAHDLEPQEAGYFALPKSVQDTRVLVWEDFGSAWVESALECAAETVRRMREGIFWPPAPKGRDAGFDDLFLGDIEGTVEWASSEGG